MIFAGTAKDYSMLDTLATAYAETGDFENAQRWQIEAIELAPETARPQLRARLELYQQKDP